MTGLKWKQHTGSGGSRAEDCWITECGYTVARCFIGEATRYLITAPSSGSPFAYVDTREEVVSAINVNKEQRNANH